MSKFQRDLNNQLTAWITQWLKSSVNMNPSHPHYQKSLSNIKKYLNDKSLIYIPRPSEVKLKITALTEKLEINSQFEKAKWLSDYIKRLESIYENKTILSKENLFSFINIIIQLSHSPLKTVCNIEMMREGFEQRYVTNKLNKIVKNKHYYEREINALEKIKTFEFEKVDYDEKTESWSDEEYNNNVRNERNNNNNNNINDNHVEEEKTREPDENKNNEIDNEKKGNWGVWKLETKKISISDRQKQWFMNYTKWFHNLEYFKNMTFPFFDNLLKLNSRCADHPNFLYIDSDFIWNRILHLYSFFSKDDISSSTFFLDKFNKFLPVDIPKDWIFGILTQLNSGRHDLNFLREISQIFKFNKIKGVVISKLTSIITDFMSVHDTIIDRFTKVLLYQKGKIENNNISKLINISTKTSHDFLNNLIEKCNRTLDKVLTQRQKISILRFWNFYENHLTPKVNYFITLSKYIITKQKEILTEKDRGNNCLLVKYMLDAAYNLSKSNNIFYIEILVNWLDTYSRFIFEFIINGNLIDVHSEFFIDHMLTTKEKKKMIFCFNEKFQIFNWDDCFKFKAFSVTKLNKFNKIVCIPLPFMLENIHFKILETAKTTFLWKNLKVINYFDDWNKDMFWCKKEIMGKQGSTLPVEPEENKRSVDECRESRIKHFDAFNELKMWNEKLEIHKNEIFEKGKEMDTLTFAVDEVKWNENWTKAAHEGSSSVIDFSKGDINAIKQNNNDFILSKEETLAHDIEMESTSITNNNVNFNQSLHLNTEVNPTNHSPDSVSICNLLHKYEEIAQEENTGINSYNIDFIIKNKILNRVLTINTEINKKFLNVLITKLNIEHYFNVAGFSMNSFIIELNNFISNQAQPTNRGNVEHNFYIKNYWNELSSSLNSDLLRFKNDIFNNIEITFSENNNFFFHSNSDLINMKYKPDLPISIFFDSTVISLYNSVFNLIVKIKRTFCLIRDISLDKSLKKSITDFPEDIRFGKHWINYRMYIMFFSSNLEFFVFHNVIDALIRKFKSKISSLNSIDMFINTHTSFIKNVFIFLGMNDSAYMKKLLKLLNMISAFPSLMNKFIIADKDCEKDMETLFMEIVNTTEKFKKKEWKFRDRVDLWKEMLSIKVN